MKSKDILLEIWELLDAYELEKISKNEAMTTHEFIQYLTVQKGLRKFKTDEISGSIIDWRSETSLQMMPMTDISVLVVLLFRYAKGYIKKALKNSNLSSVDEFSFLITLMTYESMTKTELIQKQIMEKTSGTEIINRLINRAFVEQTPDTKDKRSIRIKITAEGKKEIISLLPHMQQVAKIVAGNLTENEKSTFLDLLKKLDDFHNDIFIHKHSNNLQEIVQSMDIKI